MEIKWHGYEYEYEEKTTDWYFAVGVIAVAIAVTSVILDNVLFAIFILIGAFSLALHSAKKPNVMEFSVNQKGLLVGNKLYLYSDLDSFCINNDGPFINLLIKSKKIVMPYIIVPVDGERAEEIKNFLKNFLAEEELHEPLSHRVLEYLGF